MMGLEWAEGAVPTHYAQRALDRASQALHQILESTRDNAARGNTDAARRLDALTALSAAVQQVNNAVARNDRQKVVAAVAAVRAARTAVRPVTRHEEAA